MLRALGLLRQSNVLFSKRIHLDDQFSDAWYALALILDFQKTDMEAIHYINKALEIDKENVDYLFTYAEIQEKIGFIEEAEIAYKKVIELENYDPDIWLNYSNLLYQKNHQKRSHRNTFIKALSIILKVRIFFIDFRPISLTKGKKRKPLTFSKVHWKLKHDKHSDIFTYIPHVKDNPNLLNLLNTYKK